MTSRDHERALAGAAIVEDGVARLLLAELEPEDFTDPTARLVLWSLARGFEAERRLELEAEVVEEPPEGWVQPGVVKLVVEDLERAGLLAEAGGAAAVAALAEDRPDLREALAVGRAALEAMAPVEDEPLVRVAREMLESAGWPVYPSSSRMRCS